MAQPDGLAHPLAVFQQGLGAAAVAAADDAAQPGVQGLDVQKEHVCRVHCRPALIQRDGPGGVDGHMETVGMEGVDQLMDKAALGQGLAAGRVTPPRRRKSL